MDNWKITFGGKPMTLVGKHLAAGDRAPLFEVIDQNLQPVSLTQYKDKTVVISVFPSVDTSVCALQNIRFNREATKLDGDVAILSLSVDLPFAQKRFCAAENIDNVYVYSDYRDLDFGMKYGFVIKELRLLSRGVVVIDKKGLIRAGSDARTRLRSRAESGQGVEIAGFPGSVQKPREGRRQRSPSCGFTMIKEGSACNSARSLRRMYCQAE